ncbi:MAG: LCP family protein [bacterium]|nr:MAG: LCP family protein [bacterium]
MVVSTTLAGYFTFKSLPKVTDNQTILILGKGGEGHIAPNLTDTIMVVHFDSDNKSVGVLSLPRDIWITAIRAKLNTAYHYGGFEMAGESVKSVTGFTPDNFLVVDFTLFTDLIDVVGGIEVDVDKSFVDEKYPIAGKENDLCDGDRTYACRYETVQFTEGKQIMDGETALKFVRSRNAVLDEGSELAREKRQQNVISAIKEKMLSWKVFLDFKVVRGVYNTVLSHLETDISFDRSIALIKFVYDARDSVKFLSIPEEMFTVSQDDRRYDRQYVFLPSSGSWIEFQNWLKQELLVTTQPTQTY